MIVVDPRVTKTAMVADLHLAVRPRGDIALLNGILRVLLDEGLVDLDDVRRPRRRARRARSPTSPAWTRRAGRGRERHRRRRSSAPAALAIGRAERCVRGLDDGRQPLGAGHRDGHPAQHAGAAHRQHRPAGRGAVLDHRPVQRHGHPRDRASPRRCPATAPTTTPRPAPSWPRCWGVDEARLPAERGRAYPDIINGVVDGPDQGPVDHRHQPGRVVPQPRGARAAPSASLDLLVVQDGFETPTTALADVVLPAAIWGEKDGTFTNSERRVSRVRARGRAARARPAPTSTSSSPSPSGWGCRDELFAGWTTPEDAFDEWRRVSAGRPCDYSGITWDRIDAAGGVQWPCPAGDRRCRSAARARLYTDGRFHRPGGRAARARRSSPSRSATASGPSSRSCSTPGRTVEHWHTRTKTGRVPILEGLAPEAWVEMHPGRRRRARRRAPATGSRVASSRGAIDAHPRSGHGDRARRARCSSRSTGTSAAPTGSPIDEFDPISREPNYKQCAVRVERAVSR